MKKQTPSTCSTNKSIGAIPPAKKAVRSTTKKTAVPAMVNLVSIIDLKPGDRFVFEGKRKVYTLHSLVELSPAHLALAAKGVSVDTSLILMVVVEKCRQFLHNRYAKVILKGRAES